MRRWDELTHRSVKAYRFRQRCVMEPFKRLASITPWYDGKALARFRARKDELWKKYLTGATVLEVGCGPGTGGLETVKQYRARDYVGVDMSVGMVQDAKRTYPGVSFLAGRAEALQLADRQYDAVLTCYTLHHVPLPVRPAAIAEMARVSKGVLIIEDVYGFPRSMKGLLHEAYYRLADGSQYRYTLEEWLQVFADVKLKVFDHLNCGRTSVVYRCGAWIVRR